MASSSQKHDCSVCGASVPVDARFCPACGAPAPSAAKADPLSPSAKAGSAAPVLRGGSGAPEIGAGRAARMTPSPQGGTPAGAGAGAGASPPVGAIVREVSAEDARIGTVVSQRYRIIERIARGGMGEVYLARHDELDQRVAVKLLYAKFAEDERLAQRFFNEARSASRVNHPYAVTIYDFGQLEDGTFYIVMEYVKGRSLSQLVRRQGPLHPHLALRICAQLCEVLGTAHEQRLIHRDIKPDNIMVIEGAGGRFSVKVLDFGIAKMLDDELTGDLTQTGMTFGTPEYMSPEQASGGAIDHRTDVYSLGVVLFYTLVGRPPFQGKNKLQLLQRHIHDEPPRVTESGSVRLPTALTALIARCLAKDPADRPGSMAEMLREIERLLPRIPAPPEALRRPTHEVVASARSSRQVLDEPAPRDAFQPPAARVSRSEAPAQGAASAGDSPSSRRVPATSQPAPGRSAVATAGSGPPVSRDASDEEARPTTDLSFAELEGTPSAAWALGAGAEVGDEPAFAFDEGSAAPGRARASRAGDGGPSADFAIDPAEDTGALVLGDLSGPPPGGAPRGAPARGARRLLIAALVGLLVFSGIILAAWYVLEGPERSFVAHEEEDASGEALAGAAADHGEEEEEAAVPDGPPPWSEALATGREHFDAGRPDQAEALLNRIAEEWPLATGEELEALRDKLRRFRAMQEEVEGHLAEGACRPADEVVIRMRNELNQPLAVRFYGALSACRDAAQADRRAAEAERRAQQEREAAERRRAAEREAEAAEQEAAERRAREARERAERERRERERREREAERERTRPPSSL